MKEMAFKLQECANQVNRMKESDDDNTIELDWSSVWSSGSFSSRTVGDGEPKPAVEQLNASAPFEEQKQFESLPKFEDSASNLTDKKSAELMPVKPDEKPFAALDQIREKEDFESDQEEGQPKFTLKQNPVASVS